MRLYILGIPALALCACSSHGGASGGIDSAAAASGFSSESLYSQLQHNWSAAESMRSVSLDKIYQDTLATTTDAGFKIDQLDFSGLRSRLVGNASAMNQLSAKYPTLGELWDAAAFAPQNPPTLTAVRAIISDAHKAFSISSSGLGLLGLCASRPAVIVPATEINGRPVAPIVQPIYERPYGGGGYADGMMTGMALADLSQPSYQAPVQQTTIINNNTTTISDPTTVQNTTVNAPTSSAPCSRASSLQSNASYSSDGSGGSFGSGGSGGS